MSFTLLTDTAANLPQEVLEREQIETIAFPCFFHGEEPYDTASFDGHTFYERMRQGGSVTTAQINPKQYEEFFEPPLKRGEDVVFVGMSSGLSGSFYSAGLAALQLRERYPQQKLELVDAKGASLGEGLVVLRAARMRAAGLDAGRAARALREMVKRVCQVFTVDDLRYLKQTGRLSNAAFAIATMLQIKPILKGDEEGKIVAVQKVRGRKKAIEALAEKYRELVRSASLQTVGIAHADDPEGAAQLAALLRKLRPPKEILTVCYEPVTGSHVGPGTVALFFEGDENVRGR